jgi:hypothetical protein
MHMIFIYGAPASGKLTVAKEVAARTGYALFHNHLVVDALLAVFRFGSPEFVRLREQFWIDTIGAAADINQSLVFTFCPELSVDPTFPERIRTLVEKAGGAVSFIRLDVAEDEQERRLTSPSRTGGKLRRVEVLRSFRSNFDSAMEAMPTPEMAIDTNATPAEVAADRIVALVSDKSSPQPSVL